MRSIPLAAQIDLLDELEVGAVALYAPSVRAAGADATREALAAAGISTTSLLAHTPFDLADRSSWESQRRTAQELLDLAASFDAPLCTTTGPAIGWRYVDAATAFAELVRPLHGQLLVEQTNQLRVDLSFVFTIRDAIALGKATDLGIAAELHACWMEREIDDLISHPRIRAVQVSDFVVPTHQTPDRAVPGDGAVPLGRLLARIGRGVPIELELAGPRIDAEGEASAVRRGVAHVRALLG